MKRVQPITCIFILTAVILITVLSCSTSDKFSIEEATIAGIHEEVKAGRLTFRELTEYYIERIETYDKSTGLNAIVLVNPDAVSKAEELDDEYKRTGIMRPLHGIPVIVKDNYDTKDLQTSAGSLSLKGSIPPDDSYQVRMIREAGAIVLAKSNMAEFAFSPYQTVSSILGTTLNPYDLTRVPAGSSGGTAAAVAANFGLVGLGTDTGNSIRGPSSHAALVGFRSTIGLTSRDGIVPLYLRNDIGGPMARTVEDAVRILEVIAGYDPADPVTDECRGKIPSRYIQFLDEKGLEGARIGVLRTLSDKSDTDPEVSSLFEKAINDMASLGAEMIDPFEIPDLEELMKNQWKDAFHQDINKYLESLGENAPVKNLKEVIDSGKYSEYIENRLNRSYGSGLDAEEAAKIKVSEDPHRMELLEAILAAMDDHNVDAVIYPSWNNPPRKVGDFESPHGNNSPYISPHTGQPAFTVPMGYTYGNLPAGLQFLGRPYGEPDLIRFTYAYEQATKHRRPPEKFPPIK
ncbi:MAG: amidase [bacterium]|nr:amidase [bacterium]